MKVQAQTPFGQPVLDTITTQPNGTTKLSNTKSNYKREKANKRGCGVGWGVEMKSSEERERERERQRETERDRERQRQRQRERQTDRQTDSEHGFPASSTKLCQPVKGHSLPPRSCPPTLSAPSKRSAY